MSWQGILGHDELVEQFRRALKRQRLASSFLFVGPEGVGKRLFALKLAQTLLCPAVPESAMDPCGRCQACVQVRAGTHPDLHVVSKPADKSSVPLELLIGDREHRMRGGLCYWIAMKPFSGGRKVAILDDADYLEAEGANCLLKTLEEPPPQSVLILIGTSPARQLPTIRSRCQLVRFRPLPVQTIAELLAAQGVVTDSAEARRLAAHSGGSVRRAIQLADPELWDFRARLYEALAQPVLDRVRLTGALLQFVEQSGQEVASRRLRASQVIELAAEFYSGLLRTLVGLPQTDDRALGEQIEQAAQNRPDPALTAACLDRCLEAAEQLERNAHLPTLVECWLDELAALGGGPR